MEFPLITFAIVSYNNYKYIFEALNSVFAQDYPNIQLIIANDGSKDFNEIEIKRYLDEKMPKNISEVLVHNQETNQGTVHNVEFCRSHAKGEFIMYMAADDALNSSTVLSQYIEEFDRLGETAMVLCSRVAMCGVELDQVTDYEPDREGIQAIQTLTPEQMFSRLSHTWTIPTTTCIYRMKVYDIVGAYDTDYFIMEDGPLFIKMARLGIKVHWMDGLIAARHRGGGISHGNTLNLSEEYRKYRYDEIVFYEKEVLPYRDMLLPADCKLMQEKWDYLSRAYFGTFVLPNLHGMEKVKYALSHFPIILKIILKRTKEKAVGWIEDSYVNQNLLIISGLCLLAYVFLGFGLIPIQVNSVVLQNWMRLLFALIVICGGFAILLRILRIVRHIWKTIKYIFTGK